MDAKNRVHKVIREALDATGLPWTATMGGAHIKLKLSNRLVGIYPASGEKSSAFGVQRAIMNTLNQIQRAAAEIKRAEGAASDS
jgi:hypothetical protein